MTENGVEPKVPLLENLAWVLRDLRKVSGRTSSDVVERCAALGVPVDVERLSSWESGEALPGLEELAALLVALELSWVDLETMQRLVVIRRMLREERGDFRKVTIPGGVASAVFLLERFDDPPRFRAAYDGARTMILMKLSAESIVESIEEALRRFRQLPAPGSEVPDA